MLGTSGLSTVQVRQAPKTLPGTKAGVPLAVKYALGPAYVSATVAKVSLIPAPPLPFGDLLGRSVLSAAVVTVKRRRARSPKWKVRGRGPRGTGHRLPEASPSGAQSTSASNCDSTCDMLSTWGAHERPRAQTFYGGPATQAAFAWHVPPFQTLSIHRLFVWFRPSQPLLPAVGMVGALLKSRFPDASQGRPCGSRASPGASLQCPHLIPGHRPYFLEAWVILPGPGMWAVPPGPQRPLVGGGCLLQGPWPRQRLPTWR